MRTRSGERMMKMQRRETRKRRKMPIVQTLRPQELPVNSYQGRSC
jgi:hypothetical protein